MKKLFVLSIALFVLNSLEGYGQINGSTCNNPLVVNSLPFNDAGNTSTYGSNYLNSDVPPLATGAITNGTFLNSYLSGDEVVYAYTPICNQVVTITTTNDNSWIGLWAFTGCSFSSTVGYHTSPSGATRSIVDLPLTGGETYYFVISTWSAPQSTNYTINITLVSEDCSSGGTSGGSTCDDALVISSLPFNDAGNTSTYGSNYLNSDVPPLATGAITNGTFLNSYLSGDEVVYAYTPICNQVVTITTTNDNSWIGLWAFTGCSFSSTVGYHTSPSGATRSIVDLPLTAGETYYFVISTWAAPQSTNYTINITLVSDDCSSGGTSGGSTCDDALVISSLPFNDAGNTSTYGSNYSSSDVPTTASGAITTGTGSNSYLSGDEVVYEYTPNCDEVVSISTTNDNSWVGLWAFIDCPFSSTVGYHTSTSGTSRSISNLPLTAGVTYYFVVATWQSVLQSTDYSINITLISDDCSPNPSNDIIPTACATATYTLQPNSTIHFYDDGGPGGECFTQGAPGNYANSNCITMTTICAAPGQFLIVDFLALSMMNTISGYDWLVIYDGPGTSGPQLFNNRAGQADNDRGSYCYFYDNNDALSLCSTSQCLTFEFFASSTVDFEGWDALVSSVPIQCSPLPVELSHFSASCDDDVEVLWATESELNADKFIVEKSRNGVNWELVDELAAAGNSNSHLSYSTTDKKPYQGVSYYRLRQVDFDGKEKIYGPISVSCTDNGNSINVYPNPNNGNFTVEINSPSDIEEASLQLLDVTGKLIVSREFQIVDGVTQIMIEETQSLKPGTYVLKVIADVYFEPVKIVVK